MDFTALVSNTGDKAAMDCVLTTEISDGIGQVHRANFNLGPNQLDHRVPIGLERPRLGDLVPALANETTLYGRTLTVRVRAGRLWRARAVYREANYDPSTDAARYEAQQKTWSRGRPLAGGR